MENTLSVKGSEFTFHGFDGITGIVTLSMLSDQVVIYPKALPAAISHFPLEIKETSICSPNAADFLRYFFDTEDKNIELTFTKFPGTGNFVSDQTRKKKEASL